MRAPAAFRFSKNQKFFCVGSCFARELEDAIVQDGYSAETRQRSLDMVAGRPDLFAAKPGAIGRPNAFLNRYNTGSMALLMDDIRDDSLGDKLLYGRDQRIDFHYTRFVGTLPLDQAMERRNLIRQMYREALEASDIFVFTLGLCEAFRDIDEDCYLNITPDQRAAKGRNLEFEFFDIEANSRLLTGIVSSLRELKPDAEIVLTVSPVPLDLTFTGMDIVVANSLAKSTLLAAAHQIAASTEGCYYFPSYEMVMSSQQSQAWLWDRKHVSPKMVRHIMSSFSENHLG